MNKKENENLKNKPIKRQKITIGSIVEIPVEGNYYVYAQILPFGNCAVFDYRCKRQLTDFSVLNSSSVLFVVTIYDYIITKGLWEKVGKIPIRKELESIRNNYMYDKYTNQFSLYNEMTGEITPSTKAKARGLERAAVWAENHVEDRIRDYYNHVPCIWLKEHYELFPESLPRGNGEKGNEDNSE